MVDNLFFLIFLFFPFSLLMQLYFKYLTIFSSQYHEKNVAQKTKTLKELNKGTKLRGVNNKKLDSQLQDLNVVVNERRHIENVNSELHIDSLFIVNNLRNHNESFVNDGIYLNNAMVGFF